MPSCAGVDGDVQRGDANRLTGELLAADARQFPAFRLQRGVAPFRRRGEQHDTAGVDDQGRRILCQASAAPVRAGWI